MGDENDKFLMKQKHRLEKLIKEIDATKVEVEKLRVTSDQQNDDLLELEFQMKNILN